MNLEERARNYNQTFYKYPKIVVHRGWLYGIWYISNNLDRGGYHGSYPPSYLKRIYSLFPEIPSSNILHLFSGKIDNKIGTTFDINPDLNPDVCGDVREINKYFRSSSYDLIIADPPYEEKDFEIYGCSPFDKTEVMRNLWELLRPNGFVVWLDLIFPMYRRDQYRIAGSLGLITGTKRKVRLVSIFQKIGSGSI